MSKNVLLNNSNKVLPEPKVGSLYIAEAEAVVDQQQQLKEISDLCDCWPNFKRERERELSNTESVLLIAEFVDIHFRLIRMFQGGKVAFNRHSLERQKEKND